MHWSKRTFAMPVPASVAVAEIVCGSADAMFTVVGASGVSAGAVLSTVIVIVADVNWLPALSVVTTRRSRSPSPTDVVSNAAAWLLHVAAPAGERWNWTEATPLPPASAESLASTIEPLTLLPSVGFVTEPVGGVASTVHV